MTWKELKEYIEQMSPKEQESIVMMWPEYDCPKPIQHLHKIDKDIYVVDGWDSYCSKEYAEAHPEEDIELILQKGNYCLK